MLNLLRSFVSILQTLSVAFVLLMGAGALPAGANLPSYSAVPLFSGGDAENVSSASGIASSGFKHNYLKHGETDAALALLKKLERCRAILSPCSDEEKAEVLKDYEHYKNLSLKNTFAMLATCKAGNKTECAAMLKEAHLFNQRVTAHEMIGKIPGAQDFYISSGDHFGLDTLTSLDAIAVSEYSKAVSGAISFEEASENLYSSALASESERKLLFGAVQIIGAVGASALCPLSAGATCYGALALASANVALGANEAAEGVTQLLTNKDHRSAIERALIEEYGFSEAKAERYLNNAHLLVGMFDLIAGGAGVVKLIRKPKPIKAPTGGFGPTYRAADDPNLEKILTSYYGTAKTGGNRVGNGGLGDAVRYEKATGKLLSETGHLQKAIDQRRRLKAYVKKAENQPPGSYPNTKRDVEFAKELIKDLDDAIRY